MVLSRKFFVIFLFLLLLNFFLLILASIMIWQAVVLINDFSQSEDHRVDQIELLGSDVYQASIQCTTEMINQLMTNCQITKLIILEECSKFPCLKEYMTVQFYCTNQNYIQELVADSGGYQKNGDSKDFWGGIILIFLSSCIFFSFISLIIIGLTHVIMGQPKVQKWLSFMSWSRYSQPKGEILFDHD